MELRLGGQRARLLADRALWLPDLGALLVADVHIGKAAAFRRLGTPVPEATTAGTLQRLSALLHTTAAHRLVVLGDLLHSAQAAEGAPAAAFAAWRAHHGTVTLTLVAGNHDQRAGPPPAAWALQVVDEPFTLVPGLALVHHPREVPGHYVLAGHVHPAVVLASRGPGALRLPCFHLGPHCGVLPAFGEFTGSHVVRLQPGERAFVVADGEVREWAPHRAAAPVRP
ncbi:MAG: ligase-associated DNA damage response endonuclease PdeM [Rubrivivax sp.]|nr:ligase-associated DNA damage response endonuclease PdeM [Rubrivivax sp.]